MMIVMGDVITDVVKYGRILQQFAVLSAQLVQLFGVVKYPGRKSHARGENEPTS